MQKIMLKLAAHVLLHVLVITRMSLAGSPLVCEDLINRLKYPKQLSSERNLLFRYDYINQSHMIHVLESHTRLRDLHNRPPFFAPLIILAKTLATAYNATLASATNFPENCYKKRDIPVLLFFGRLTEIGNTSLALLPMEDMGYNFLYCQHRKHHVRSMDMLGIFGDSADFSVWICLTFSLLLITIIMKCKTGRKFSDVLLFTSAVLLSSGSPGVRINSKLFLLWTFTCLVFVTYYSSSLTSVVINPPPDERITNIEELHANQYNLWFASKISQIRAKAAVAHELHMANKNSDAKKRLEILSRMFQTSKVHPSFHYGYNETFLLGKKFARYGEAVATLISAYQLKAFLKRIKMSDIICCYSGERQELVRATYFHVSKTENIRELRSIFLKLLEAGYISLLGNEYFLTLVYARVQDRPKVIDRSFTKLPEEVVPWNTQDLSDGKLQVIFKLWGTCLGISFLVMVAENIQLGYNILVLRTHCSFHSFLLFLITPLRWTIFALPKPTISEF